MTEPPSASKAAKWNARYAYSGATVPPPADVLSRHEALLPNPKPPQGSPTDDLAPAEFGWRGEALDLACGKAGNGEWLGARGFSVTAWDLSDTVIQQLRERPNSRIAHAEIRNVLVDPPEANRFDVIVVARFLERSLCPAIADALHPGGRLFYQTFTHGLSRPEFMLAPNELLDLFPTLDILSYREPEPDAKGRAEAMLVGRRGY